MRSKNSPPMTAAEAEHVALVKMAGCVVCGEGAPNEAHHINQREHFTTVALCALCHRDPQLGWHGARTMWRIHKLDELGALNLTLARVAELRKHA